MVVVTLLGLWPWEEAGTGGQSAGQKGNRRGGNREGHFSYQCKRFVYSDGQSQCVQRGSVGRESEGMSAAGYASREERMHYSESVVHAGSTSSKMQSSLLLRQVSQTPSAPRLLLLPLATCH